MRLSPRALGAALLFAGGAFATGAAFLPGRFGFALLLSLAPLVACLRGVRPLRAFLLGWLFGTLAWGVGLYWFPPVVAEYSAGLPGLRWIFFLAIIAYLGLEVALAAWLIRFLADGLARAGLSETAALAAASLPAWVCVDGYFPPLFPAPIATTQLFHLPLVQSLDLFGAAGVAWIIAVTNAGIFLSVVGRGRGLRRWAPLAAAAGLLALNEGYGILRMRAVDAAVARHIEEGRTLSIALVQASIPFSRRRTGQFVEANLTAYRALSEEALEAGPLDLIVWPQNTYERRLRVSAEGRVTIHGEDAAAVLGRDLPYPARSLVTTLAQVEGSGQRYASVLFGPERGIEGVSYKRSPTPLSEYFPMGSVFPFLYRLTPRMNRIQPGPQEPIRVGDARVGVYICYDGMKPGSARDLARSGAQVLINPSSDQWSRDRSVQPLQAFAVTRLRAIETRRYLIRSTPNGMSSVVDAVGRLVDEIPIDGKGVLRANVPLLDGAPVAGALGPALYRLALLLAAALFVAGRRRGPLKS